GALYQHAGAGNGWSWTPLGTAASAPPAPAFDASGGLAHWTVPRAALGATRACGARQALLAQAQGAAGILCAPPAGFALADDPSCAPGGALASHVPFVFVIAMENEPAAAIYGSSHAPYINGELVPR